MSATAAQNIRSHPAKRLSILLHKGDHPHHGSLMIQIIQHAHKAKLAGATAFQAHEGYGASGRVHRTHILSEDAPVRIVIIDTPDRINFFLAEMADLLDDVLVVVDDVDVVDN